MQLPYGLSLRIAALSAPISILIAGIFLALTFTSCGGGADTGDRAFVRTAGNAGSGSVSHSTSLRIELVDDGYYVEVRNPMDTSEVLASYHLSRKNKTEIGEEHSTIRIPIERMALGSTTFVPYFEHLGAAQVIRGVTYATQVRSEEIAEQVNEGFTLEIAGDTGIDPERLLMTDADVAMVYLYGNSNFRQLQELGIPVVLNMEYQESSPLARAEWVKLSACLLDRLAEAEAIFGEIEDRYMEISQLAKDASYAPKVFSGSKYERKWFAPGRSSFVAQYIRDAGGRYAFEHVEGSGSVELDFESVLSTLVKCDYWGLITSSEEEFALSHLIRVDPQYALFEAFRSGQVFVCNTAKSDYFGNAVMEPDVVLADLVAIIHPDLLPGHESVYFHLAVRDVKA